LNSATVPQAFCAHQSIEHKPLKERIQDGEIKNGTTACLGVFEDPGRIFADFFTGAKGPGAKGMAAVSC
jgi:hypothetical protein